ncbi:hypothetical protein M501DRAFT_994092 [Patellaria atrata CBS 101060]|uniref:Uncharacterized protein n=1 Tax=Patellaria atrata CBS 101060 TaxID=1346257 RepID=A0A9P4VRR7_9PEZI|nr:hypothetical protein M501DRAFT_994092 [Patellaria atrata CBS 101060]
MWFIVRLLCATFNRTTAGVSKMGNKPLNYHLIYVFACLSGLSVLLKVLRKK